jgi:DNA-binding response OmpR family regulator
MPYIFKNKFDIRELVGQPVQARRILIAEPESYACALFAYHLTAEDYFVKSCGDLASFHSHLGQFAPNIAVVNPVLVGNGIRRAASFLRQVKERYPSLLLMTVSLNGDAQDIKHLMAAGVNAHVDRKFTKPQDVIALIHSLLHY